MSLGSNLGDREAHLGRSVDRLRRIPGVQVLATSSIYETEPVDIAGQSPVFLNQGVLISSGNAPEELLRHCQDTEVLLGRPEDHPPQSPRTIDIDIITYGSLVRKHAPPILPHPRYSQRKFVLVPLAELLPDFRDPNTGMTVHELLRACPDPSRISLYASQAESIL